MSAVATTTTSPAADLLTRAHELEAEVTLLSSRAEENADTYLAIRAVSLANEIRLEARALAAVVAREGSSSSSSSSISSNLPFFAAVWDAAKRARDIVAVRYRVAAQQEGAKKNAAKKDTADVRSLRPVLAPGLRVVRSRGDCEKGGGAQLIIDVVADAGRSWWKVSTVTNRRLLFDLAKEGLVLGAGDAAESEEADVEGGIGDGDGDGDGDGEWDGEGDEDGDGVDGLAEAIKAGYEHVPLVKMVRGYVEAARARQIRNGPPEMHIVLPRIEEGVHREIDMLVAASRALGAHVHTRLALPSDPSPPLSPSLLDVMAPGPSTAFSDTLNIDTSILVALASDFCHRTVEPQDWFGRSHRSHWAKEEKEKMMHDVLPALAGRDLVCTAEAAETFRHIIQTIGTDEEQARGSLVIGQAEARGGSSAERVAAFRLLSIHQIPETLRLPVLVVTTGNDEQLRSKLPDVAHTIFAANPDMLNPGLSVFTYGWASGCTTVTSNLVVARGLGKALEEHGELPEAEWPRVWVTRSSRPLVGVPKGTRIRTRKHVGDCSGGCVCGLDRFHGGKTYEVEDEGGEEDDGKGEGEAEAADPS